MFTSEVCIISPQIQQSASRTDTGCIFPRVREDGSLSSTARLCTHVNWWSVAAHVASVPPATGSCSFQQNEIVGCCLNGHVVGGLWRLGGDSRGSGDPVLGEVMKQEPWCDRRAVAHGNVPGMRGVKGLVGRGWSRGRGRGSCVREDDALGVSGQLGRGLGESHQQVASQWVWVPGKSRAGGPRLGHGARTPCTCDVLTPSEHQAPNPVAGDTRVSTAAFFLGTLLPLLPEWFSCRPLEDSFALCERFTLLWISFVFTGTGSDRSQALKEIHGGPVHVTLPGPSSWPQLAPRRPQPHIRAQRHLIYT